MDELNIGLPWNETNKKKNKCQGEHLRWVYVVWEKKMSKKLLTFEINWK